MAIHICDYKCKGTANYWEYQVFSLPILTDCKQTLNKWPFYPLCLSFLNKRITFAKKNKNEIRIGNGGIPRNR